MVQRGLLRGPDGLMYPPWDPSHGADSSGLPPGKEHQVKDSDASSEVSDASDTSRGNFNRVTFAADTDRSPASKGKGRGRGRSSV